MASSAAIPAAFAAALAAVILSGVTHGQSATGYKSAIVIGLAKSIAQKSFD